MTNKNKNIYNGFVRMIDADSFLVRIRECGMKSERMFHLDFRIKHNTDCVLEALKTQRPISIIESQDGTHVWKWDQNND